MQTEVTILFSLTPGEFLTLIIDYVSGHSDALTFRKDAGRLGYVCSKQVSWRWTEE